MATTAAPKVSLQRYLDAQAGTSSDSRVPYDAALAEMQAGRKRSCWIWYVYPQFKDPSRLSGMNERYQIYTAEEAVAYVSHNVLGQRLIEITQAVHKALQAGMPSHGVMGTGVDAKKLHQSLTVFLLAAHAAGLPEMVALFTETLDLILQKPYAAKLQLLDPLMVARWQETGGLPQPIACRPIDNS
jgi:uncharacterized protein (DUF1810 family)